MKIMFAAPWARRVSLLAVLLGGGCSHTETPEPTRMAEAPRLLPLDTFGSLKPMPAVRYPEVPHGTRYEVAPVSVDGSEQRFDAAPEYLRHEPTDAPRRLPPTGIAPVLAPIVKSIRATQQANRQQANRQAEQASRQALTRHSTHRVALGRDVATPAAAAEQAMERTQRGIASARRGALFSARADFIDALQQLAEARDRVAGGTTHATALREGLRALKEADEFARAGASWDSELNLKHLIQSHRTPVLKQTSVDQMSPSVAMDHYLDYAQRRLAQSTGPGPVASVTLYSLGRLQDSLTGESKPGRRSSARRAMAFYQAALLADDRNRMAANELGVLLVRSGRLPEARRVLRLAVSFGAPAATWHNLAVVHERLGERKLADLARQESEMARRNTVHEPSAPSVAWVPHDEFARISKPFGEGAPAEQPARQSSLSPPPSRPTAASRSTTASRPTGPRRGFSIWPWK